MFEAPNQSLISGLFLMNTYLQDKIISNVSIHLRCRSFKTLFLIGMIYEFTEPVANLLFELVRKSGVTIVTIGGNNRNNQLKRHLKGLSFSLRHYSSQF